MIAETSLRFRTGDTELSGRIAVPPGARQACVVCHPHPLYGGDMHNPVVVAITQALSAAGVATLRFDFRGVGQSGGTHGGGTAEVDDARAALVALAAATGLGGAVVAGYSFGSLVALRLAQADDAVHAAGARVAAVAAIAPPLVMFDAAFVAQLTMPTLLVAGDRDVYCPEADFEALAAALAQRSATVLVHGADHFLAGREREVADSVSLWVTALAGVAPG